MHLQYTVRYHIYVYGRMPFDYSMHGAKDFGSAQDQWYGGCMVEMSIRAPCRCSLCDAAWQYGTVCSAASFPLFLSALFWY